MPTPPKIKKITLSGFRAYLYEQDIDLPSGSSLVIYAPNGKGKSSLVDAIEFLFSGEGIVRRLGKSKSGTQAGKEALTHHDAKKLKITPFVQADFQSLPNLPQFKRLAEKPEQLPVEVVNLLSSVKVDFIIRGFELRKFVEAESPEQRYEAVASWFGFTPLLSTQESLRALRVNLNSAISDSTLMNQIHHEVQTLTSYGEQQWNEGKLVTWYNQKLLLPLDTELKIESLDSCEDAEKTLDERAADETSQTSSALNKTVSDQIKNLLGDSGATPPTVGHIDACSSAITTLKSALDHLENTKSLSEKSVFANVWREAKAVFSNPNTNFDLCPVCDVPLAQSPHKSKDGIKLKLEVSLSDLQTFHDAETALKTAKSAAEQKVRQVKHAVDGLVQLLKQTQHATMAASLSSVSSLCENYDYSGSAIELQDAKATLDQLKSIFSAPTTVPDKTKPSWKGALDALNKLKGLKERADSETKRKTEIEKIHTAVQNYATTVDGEVKKYVEGLIAALTDKINFFYKEIQTGVDRVPTIHLAFPPGDKKVQHQLNLLIDFSENRKGVHPSGYLSDSQVHTLAISIRLAAICLFNRGFPLIVLDDIVTSYDVDRRKAVVDLIAKHFTDYQIVIMTHDEQFFRLLDEQLNQAGWKFKRIMKIDPGYGPKYTDSRIHDEQIEALHKDEQSAANHIRQAEEEWLGRICRQFRLKASIPDVNRPYDYKRPELASALQEFLVSNDLMPPNVAGHQNPFLRSLQKNSVENLGSHFQENPQIYGSVGDEIGRWSNFKEFRNRFECTGCKKKRFKRPESVNRPLCYSCEQPFAFT